MSEDWFAYLNDLSDEEREEQIEELHRNLGGPRQSQKPLPTEHDKADSGNALPEPSKEKKISELRSRIEELRRRADEIDEQAAFEGMHTVGLDPKAHEREADELEVQLRELSVDGESVELESGRHEGSQGSDEILPTGPPATEREALSPLLSSLGVDRSEWPEADTEDVDASSSASKTGRAWIFQAVPRKYDLESELHPGKIVSWRATRNRNEIRPGDIVYLWASGERAGLYGVGRVCPSGQAVVQKVGEGDDRERIPIEFTYRLDPFIPKAVLGSDPVFAGHTLLKAPRGTVFRLDSSQARVLLELVRIEQALDRRGSRRQADWKHSFGALQERVRRVATARTKARPQWQRVSAPELRERLRKKGFFLSLEVAQELMSALQKKRLIVLRGVPGTGKSLLSRLMPEILLPAHPKKGQAFTEVFVHPDLSAEDFIGSRKMTSSHQIGPSCGPFLESVLCCHESDDGYWLLLDELNRCSVDMVFAPLLDALARDQGYVQHPFMFPDQLNEEARVQIPASFRIIGTMNPFDRGLFEMSQALLQRVTFVDIPTLRGDEELLLIRQQVIEPWIADSKQVARPRREQLAEEALGRLQELVESIRDLTSRSAEFAACELGSRLVMSALAGFLFHIQEHDRIDSSDANGALDKQVSSELFLQLESCGTLALRVIAEEILSKNDWPFAARTVDKMLQKRRVY